MSLSLGSDNHSGIHPAILKSIVESNTGHAHSYGLDPLSSQVESEWRRVLGREAQIFYVFNGTGANVLALQSMLRPFEAAVASDQSHLHLDECGAPDQKFKLYLMPSTDGKIQPEQLRDVLARRGDQHFAQPRAVSLVLPTEFGVCYTLEELAAWRKFADQNKLLIHWDGARLANFASFHKCTIAAAVEAGRPDAISFGGTKNGMLGAEAVVLFDGERAKDFKYIRKQGLHLPSKTRFLAAQFHGYFQNDLWREIADHVTSEARYLAGALSKFPQIQLAFPVQSNALFVKIPKAWIEPLKQDYFFYIWDVDQNMLRWMISFDWRREHSEKLLNRIDEVRRQWPA